LLGRSKEPTPEPEWLHVLEDESSIKSEIVARSENIISPQEINNTYRTIRNNREMMKNIDRMTAAGASVHYFSVDIRDKVSVTSLIKQVVMNGGLIRGLIHGAGVLADRLLEDKTDEDFNLVYDTKVFGLLNILGALDTGELKTMVFFSSSTARFGRKGQVDYAVANEVLNKLAQQQIRRLPHCRILSINWGPWDGGMVTAGLKKIFENVGVGVIGLEAGSKYLISELESPDRYTGEIVILGTRNHKKHSAALQSELKKSKLVPLSQQQHFHVSLEQNINLESYPFLKSHVIDGKAVVPLMMLMEWSAHAALHSNPCLRFHGFDDFRVLKGVILAKEPYILRFFTGKPEKCENYFKVPLEIQGIDTETNYIHAQSQVILVDKLPQPEMDIPVIETEPFSLSSVELYEKHLFHGPDLQGIL